MNIRYPIYEGVYRILTIHLNDIRRIKRLDLSLKPHLDFARDMFLFCFYTRGMSFVDMAYLKKGDIANGILTYRRKKTGQQLFIRWEKCMQEIIKLFLFIGSRFQSCSLIALLVISRVLFVRDSTNK